MSISFAQDEVSDLMNAAISTLPTKCVGRLQHPNSDRCEQRGRLARLSQVRTKVALFALALAGHNVGTLAPRCSLLSRMFYNLLRAVLAPAPDAGQNKLALHLPKDHRCSNRQPKQKSIRGIAKINHAAVDVEAQ